jgi:hypothetical protein
LVTGYGMMIAPRSVLSVLAAGVLLFACAARVESSSNDEIQSVVRATLADSGLQTWLPADARNEEPRPAKTPSKIEALPSDTQKENPNAGQGWLDLLRLLFWMALICAAIVLAYWLLEMFPERRFRLGRAAAQRPDAIGEENDKRRDPLAVSDRLAEEGRLTEAMHVLLLAVIAVLRRLEDQDFSTSLTSREILRVLKLSSDQRRAMSDMIDRVERSWFGGHAAAAEDYLLCRERFSSLIVTVQGAR